VYGHIISIYRRSGERGGRKVGAGKKGKRRGIKRGDKGSVRKPR